MITTTEVIISELLIKGYKIHHRALGRGYVTRNKSYKESYAGRFGEGFKVHQANAECTISNRFHNIYYLVK